MVAAVAALAVLGFGMGSFVDSIDNSTKLSDNQQEQQAKSQKFWTVVSSWWM
jgi:hypothetical protein